MDFERLNGDIKEMRRRNRILALTVGVLADGHLLALVVILNLLGAVRTVVVPPSINKSFWVSRDKASNEYLELMGSFIARLVLDVRPASIDWKKEMLLGYVEPAQHGELKTRQELEVARLKRINASTFFMPQQLVPSEDAQSLVVRGAWGQVPPPSSSPYLGGERGETPCAPCTPDRSCTVDASGRPARHLVPDRAPGPPPNHQVLQCHRGGHRLLGGPHAHGDRVQPPGQVTPGQRFPALPKGVHAGTASHQQRLPLGAPIDNALEPRLTVGHLVELVEDEQPARQWPTLAKQHRPVGGHDPVQTARGATPCIS